ncbi:MAG: hypothetical protein ACI9IL_000750 [Rickettsiales bacterium]|jgi:hypothetical protein
MLFLLKIFKKNSKSEGKIELAEQDIFLDVSFSQKDEAKSFGARWNPKIKKWFIPAGINKSPLKKWIPKK